MELSSFSPLIELSAALNVAFVAIEYAKSFTRGIVRRLFKHHNLIDARLAVCLEKLYDELTINNIHFVTFEGGKTTEGKLNESKRKYKKLREDIEKSRVELCNKVDNMCSSKCLPTLCLFLFLYNIAQLFFSAFESKSVFLGYEPYFFFACSFFFLTCFTVVFLICAWFLAEHSDIWVNKFSSSRWTGITFSLCVIASLALGSLCLCDGFVAFVLSILDVVIVVGVLLTFINLSVILLLLRDKGRKAITHIEKEYNDFEGFCKTHNEDIEKHMHCAELEMDPQDSDT